MKEIINYLIKIEKMAGEIYEDASAFFDGDKEFAGFLGLLAEDEAYHFSVIAHADEFFEKETADIPPFIALDDITKEKLERPFIAIRKMLQAGNLSKEDMISFIVTMEFSEWNHIFLYVVNTFRNRSQELQDAVANVHHHKKRIEAFLESLSMGRQHLETIRALPSVWRENILIVDDSEPIVEFLAAVFEKVGMVETALDGEEALRKTKEHYFDAIISDVDILGISGIEFYKQAAEIDPSIGERFLFLTGFPKPETIDFFLENNLKYIIKPATIEELRKAVNEIVARGSTPQ